MTTVIITPRTVYNGGSTNLTITDSNNMLDDTSSTTYGTVTCTRNATTSYYIYLRDFDWSVVPPNAIVSDITIKVKGYHSGGNTGTLYMYDGTSASVAACGSGTAFTTSASVITFSNTTIDWNTLNGYGSDFGLRIDCRRSNRNNANTIYVYGAEIDVTYTLPAYHTVTSSTSDGTIIPSGSTNVLEGDDYTLAISNVNSPVVTDNNVDVSSRLVQATSGTRTYIPYNNTISGFTSSDITDAYSDASSTTSATLNLAGRVTGTLYLDLGGLTIPSSATIQSVSCLATLRFNRNGSSSSVTASFQLYSGNNAKGSATSWLSSATDVSRTTYTLTAGNWTVSEIADAKFYLTAYNGASSTKRVFYVYGVSFNVTFEYDGVVYTYTINNVIGNHTIAVSAGASTEKIYIKENGSWVQYSRAYKKVSGSWVEQTTLSSVFSLGTNYIKGN